MHENLLAAPETTTQWKLTLAYDGTGFHGWQVQPGQRTVQGTLAAVIEQVFGERVLPQGSGRTDAGVHALGQVCSFGLVAPVPAERLEQALNRVLPPSVRVLRAQAVEAGFHARHSARGKTYEYRIWERRKFAGDPSPGVPSTDVAERPCSPFLAPFVWDCRWPLRLDAMQEAAQALVGTHDFTSFAARDAELAERRRAAEEALRGNEAASANAMLRGNVRTVTGAVWTRAGWRERGQEGECESDRTGGATLRFRIAGDGFLHHMVRNIVGTLVDVGRGALGANDVARILAARDRSQAGPTAPAQGLFLVAVRYEETEGAA